MAALLPLPAMRTVDPDGMHLNASHPLPCPAPPGVERYGVYAEGTGSVLQAEGVSSDLHTDMIHEHEAWRVHNAGWPHRGVPAMCPPRLRYAGRS